MKNAKRYLWLVGIVAAVLFWPDMSNLRAQSEPTITLIGYTTVHAALRAEPQAGSVCGTGIAHCVILTWAAPPTGTAPTTYNVKRSTTSGTEITIGSTTAPTTTYTDSTGTGGTTYFYVVTAVNPQASPTESAPSNEVSATFLPLAQPGAPVSLAATRN